MRQRAYPRSRGATTKDDNAQVLAMGLSPLARGNLLALYLLARAAGPIPARAGQPFTVPGIEASCGAYPRSRGATPSSAACTSRMKGLSPLARGNRLQVDKQ